MALLGKNANKSVRSGNYINGISRTKCPRHFKFHTTFTSGKLIPLFCDEFNPAETKSVSIGELVRSITPLGPVMDNSFLDIFCFFVPNRLVWDHWEEFIAGYNKEAWAQDVEYLKPRITFTVPAKGLGTLSEGEYVLDDDEKVELNNRYLHSFLDYMYGACDVVNLSRAFDAAAPADSAGTSKTPSYSQSQINNLFWIDALYPRSYVKIWNDWFRDENLQDEYQLYTGDNDEDAQSAFSFDLLSGDALPCAAKYHNRFTSALPSPVKGPDVLIPMTDLRVGYNSTSTGTLSSMSAAGIASGTVLTTGKWVDVTMPGMVSNPKITAQNVSNTIRMLRLATQTELLLSRDARGGTRYVESLLSHFGVRNGDARLQRSEYLGSRQIPLSMVQITNTSQAGDNALGNVGGQSVTRDNAHYFTYSASEHGILWIVGCVRTNLSYSSGVRKIYQRRGRFEHIWPEFKHVGDVPLYTREHEQSLDLLSQPDLVFGYTPYGSELREGLNINSGLFRSKASGNLSYLTYQESYIDDDTYPMLNDVYIRQPKEPIANTLIDQNGPQFYALFDIYMEDTIPLDPTSDPGLMDHF